MICRSNDVIREVIPSLVLDQDNVMLTKLLSMNMLKLHHALLMEMVPLGPARFGCFFFQRY